MTFHYASHRQKEVTIKRKTDRLCYQQRSDQVIMRAHVAGTRVNPARTDPRHPPAADSISRPTHRRRIPNSEILRRLAAPLSQTTVSSFHSPYTQIVMKHDSATDSSSRNNSIPPLLRVQPSLNCTARSPPWTKSCRATIGVSMLSSLAPDQLASPWPPTEARSGF
jgi:hypothetical protein